MQNNKLIADESYIITSGTLEGYVVHVKSSIPYTQGGVQYIQCIIKLTPTGNSLNRTDGIPLFYWNLNRTCRIGQKQQQHCLETLRLILNNIV